MIKVKFLLLTLLSVLGMNTGWAETVSPYKVDFNKSISTSVHDFAVASNWSHIVPNSDYDGYGPYYMSYSYYAAEGINGSGTLLCNRQYAGDYAGGEVVKDILVTPVVSGNLTLYVKPSNLASSSNPSFVEFYEVSSDGNQLGSLIKRFTVNDEVNPYVPDAENEGWSTVSISVSEAQRIGIRGQYVYLDDFSATSAEVVLEKKLTVTKLTAVQSGTYYPSQKEDGSVDISLMVTLKNDGDIDLKAGDENYFLTLVKREYYGSATTEIDDATFQIEKDLAVGEETTFTANFTASNLGTGWMYLKVKENISGNISSAMVQTQVQEYASKFIFDKEGSTYYSSSSPTTTPISLGKVSEATTLNYEIYNSGSAPLTINSLTIDAPFTTDAPAGEFTVAGGEKKVVAITLAADNPGIFSGNLTIEYTNFGKEKATYTLGISGTVVDPSKNLITFDNGENGQFPAGSIHSDQVYISSKTDGDVTNWYLQSTSTTTKFITPLLTAEAGEAFTYDVWYSSYSSSAEVIVYTSKDRQTWTQVDRKTSSAISSSVSTFSVNIEEAGDYYLAFELKGNALLDNIYGLTLAAAPEHDWYVTGNVIPTKGKQNATYTATIDVQNISAEADVIETATLYMDGEAVATVENVSLPGNEKTAAVGTGRNDYCNIEDPVSVTFSFKPHFFGTVPAYIELKSGDKSCISQVVDVNIEKEVASSVIAVGEAKSKNTETPFYTTWFDTNDGAMSDFYYSKEELEAFGIKAGDVITSISFKGAPKNDKTFVVTMEAWVGTQDAESFAPGNADKDNMLYRALYNGEEIQFVSGEEMTFTIDLSDNPITWDGESIIRIFTNGNGNGSWINFDFQTDNSYRTAYYGRGTNPSWSPTNTPVGYFALAIENRTFSGNVVDEVTGNPIEGATVTIRNEAEDVEYTATTDAEGIFNIDVVQNTLTYTATVTAEGYEDLVIATHGYDFSNESIEENFSMTPIEQPIENVNVPIGESTYATLYYENLNLQAPEEVKVYTVTINGNTAVLNRIESGIIPAGVAVIVNGAPQTYEFTVLDEVDKEAMNISSDLIGTENGGTITSEDYLYVLSWKNAQKNIDEVGFYWQQGTNGHQATVLGHQAYLRLSSAQSNGFRFSFGEETGIDTVELPAITDADTIYNLSGVRVSASQMRKGVYVVNGKKVVIK